MQKKRLDLLLAERGYYETRTKAQAAVMAGLVLVNDVKIDKPGTPVASDVTIRILGKHEPFVSRGGRKLAKAITEFHLQLEDKVVADIGASTGGFTDCALQNGARRVYAIDVGYGQLAWQLRNDPRVVNLERTNIRYAQEDIVPEKVDLATIDVSFISLSLVLPAVLRLLQPAGEIIALIKPQFEAGKEKVGKHGVVRSGEVHADVITKIVGAAQTLGLVPSGLEYSPIRGPEGNIEYLLYLLLAGNPAITAEMIKETVSAAHSSFA